MKLISTLLILTLVTLNATRTSVDEFIQFDKKNIVDVKMEINLPHNPEQTLPELQKNYMIKNTFKILEKIILEFYLFCSCTSFAVYAFILPPVAQLIFTDTLRFAHGLTLYVFYNYIMKMFQLTMILLKFLVVIDEENCLMHLNTESYHDCWAIISPESKYYFYILMTLPLFATFLVTTILPAVRLDALGYVSFLVNVKLIAARSKTILWFLLFWQCICIRCSSFSFQQNQ